jgi:hypothetical protein
MKSLTIKNIESIMEGIASEHPQINTVLKGNVWDVDLTKDVTGVYLIYEVTNIAPNGFNGIDYSIDIFLCDNVTEINTATNEVSVQNECSLIALDMMSIFENYNKSSWADKDLNLVLNKTWSVQPFTERFDSLYSGAAVNVSLSTSYGYARCQVPTAAPINLEAPIVSGITERGETLACTEGVWQGIGVITYTYQWRRNFANIEGATDTTYTLGYQDDNAFISCNVTASDSSGTTTKLSNVVGAVLAAPYSLFAPIVSGTFRVGSTITSTEGVWQGIPTITFAYQWRRFGVNIDGETTNEYTLVIADYNTAIDCVITATNSLGVSSADSNDAIIQGSIPIISGLPFITGVVSIGRVLTANAASTSGFPTPNTTWQWQISNDGVSGWANIEGETEQTYLITLSDEFKYIRVKQTETNVEGADSADSLSTIQVAEYLFNWGLSSVNAWGEVTDETWG